LYPWFWLYPQLLLPPNKLPKIFLFGSSPLCRFLLPHPQLLPLPLPPKRLPKIFLSGSSCLCASLLFLLQQLLLLVGRKNFGLVPSNTACLFLLPQQLLHPPPPSRADPITPAPSPSRAPLAALFSPSLPRSIPGSPRALGLPKMSFSSGLFWLGLLLLLSEFPPNFS